MCLPRSGQREKSLECMIPSFKNPRHWLTRGKESVLSWMLWSKLSISSKQGNSSGISKSIFCMISDSISARCQTFMSVIENEPRNFRIGIELTSLNFQAIQRHVATRWATTIVLREGLSPLTLTFSQQVSKMAMPKQRVCRDMKFSFCLMRKNCSKCRYLQFLSLTVALGRLFTVSVIYFYYLHIYDVTLTYYQYRDSSSRSLALVNPILPKYLQKVYLPQYNQQLTRLINKMRRMS